MATASVTYDFSALDTARSAEVDANFADLVGFINTNAIQKDGTTAMTGALTLSGDPTVANHATRKGYVDQYRELSSIITIAAGPKFGAGPHTIGTKVITDPGYNIEVWGAAVVLAQGQFLNYWQLQWLVDGATLGAIAIPCAQTSVDQTFACLLAPVVHTTVKNCSIRLQWSRKRGANDSTIASDGRYNSAFIKYRKAG